jgi:lysophospholipid acyltransferase (LPLAT)-like uncharacterized protein
VNDERTASERRELRNTLYRRLTRAQRRLTPGRMLLYRVAVFLALVLLRFFWGSCRLQPIAGLEGARAALRQHGSVIPVYWHQHLLFGVRALVLLEPEGLRPGFLISPSVDGTAPAMLVHKLGGHVIRGSSTHTGARALRDFYETIVKQQVSPAITPDGPRGPVHEFKQGAVMLAQLSGRPILPIAVAASRTLRLSTWDRFELPLPFSRVAISIGDPVPVPRALDAAGQAQLARDLAQRLHALKAAGLASLGRAADPAPGDGATHDR